MKFDVEDPVKYETVVISLAYKTNIFLKTYRFNGGVAAVQGNGEFVDLARVQGSPEDGGCTGIFPGRHRHVSEDQTVAQRLQIYR